MFVLRTGLQGNGKTLNTIKEVDTKAHAENRTVYYCNVTGFKPDHPAIKATWVEFDYPERWFELPPNAIIVIDEAQTWFRVRPQGSKVPDYASRLEIMRKDGHEVHAITQSPKLIDSHMRELCNMHIHYNRGNGGAVIKRWVFQKPELSVSSKLDFPDGEYTRITIDKSYFGCYQSVKDGTEHHFKFRPPKALLVLGFVALVISAIGYYLYDRLTGFVEASEAPASAVSAGVLPGAAMPLQQPQAAPVDRPATVEEYMAARTPRIPGIPQTAPIFDELTKPVAFPKPSCVSTKDEEMIRRNEKRMALGYYDGRLHGCRCNSQQGTRMHVDFNVCMDIVNNGAFDYTRPDQLQQQAADVGGLASAASGTPAAVAQTEPRLPVYGISNVKGALQ
jgi:hypothetical protein